LLSEIFLERYAKYFNRIGSSYIAMSINLNPE
jgi:hypothetical protein